MRCAKGQKSSFYDDALQSFRQAETIEPKDFVVQNRIGQVHLYSEAHLDFARAEQYFLNSAREAFAEATVEGTATARHLVPEGQQSLWSLGSTDTRLRPPRHICTRQGLATFSRNYPSRRIVPAKRSKSCLVSRSGFRESQVSCRSQVWKIRQWRFSHQSFQQTGCSP